MGTPETLADMMKRIARIIPGIGTYQDRESRRDTDKRFRVWLADRLDEERRRLESIKEKMSLEYIDDLDSISRVMQRLGDTLRYASYGFGGLFDSIKIDDDKLSEIYRFDLDIAGEIDGIRTALDVLAEKATPDTINKTRDSLGGLDQKLRRRNELFLDVNRGDDK